MFIEKEAFKDCVVKIKRMYDERKQRRAKLKIFTI